MNLTQYRDKLSVHIDKVSRPFNRFTPNQITLLSFIFALVSMILYYKRVLYLAPIFLFISAILDLVDGNIARRVGLESKFGATIDWIVDKYIDCLIIISITLGGFVSAKIALFAVFGSMINTFIKPVTYIEIGFEKRVDGKIIDPLEGIGFFGRPETIIVILIASVIEIFFSNALLYGIYVIAIMTNLSAIDRIIYLYKTYG
ncbi:MAG: CDP-alcohol phosphatidyltransferase family protein [Candidatus Methanoliparum thermophilum]|uniref:CDP-alcohol phosphatidyltransferase family protein n=1 Tax=Methanoliparum thermophilum TaxID=2491083 RepID=A0A520KQN7_METT2|nr:CDP-alcohol phosphatidyltransferase family protein [Candidatus Methanoliparum sp. LAM-1]RZN63885.1 MAG: CDP-alcohol phosphatidyltransferase family protein [Candidatus Methanoliparum thermophilum]BDC36385.1 CDP-alcohol phosphatidyltransferase [Candidatus Methanoliparum sp. LAM-1]